MSSELRKTFLKSTGLTFDIDKILNNVSDEQKTKIFNKINWQLKRGIIDDDIKSSKSEENVDVIIKLAEKLNISEVDLDGDGEVSDSEKLLSEILITAKEKKEEIIEYKKENQSTTIINGISSEEELVNACVNGGEYTLTGNVDLIDMVMVSGQVVLNLNGYSITKSTNTASGKCVIFYISGEGASLTINGTGKIEALGGLTGGTGVNVIIWTCDNTTVILNGGYYHAAPKNGTDMIYNQGGQIFINGGEYVVDTPNTYSNQKQYTICNVYDSKRKEESFVIKGGKFHNFNPMNNLSEGANTNFVAKGYTTNNEECYNVSMGEVIYEVVKDLIDSEEKLVKAIQNNNEVTLDADIVLSNYIEIRDKELTINLNDHKLSHLASSSAQYKDVFELYGTTKLIINGDGELFAEDGYCIYAAGDSSCEINGGKYISPVSCVDARKNAIVTINGGEFIVDGSNNPSGDFGQVYTLNLRDKKGNYENELANFIVKGGKFYKFNPSESNAEPTVTNFVDDDYKVVENDDWFEVVKA